VPRVSRHKGQVSTWSFLLQLLQRICPCSHWGMGKEMGIWKQTGHSKSSLISSMEILSICFSIFFSTWLARKVIYSQLNDAFKNLLFPLLTSPCVHWTFVIGNFESSDRQKFGSVPAEIKTETKISVSVPARFVISVLTGISVQNWAEINYFFVSFEVLPPFQKKTHFSLEIENHIPRYTINLDWS
jgi:hypothetical protein